jgi:hypothetical protein
MNLRNKQMLAESFLCDVMSQLDVVDPSQECEEIVEVVSTLSQSTEGKFALTFLLGLSDPDEIEGWIEENSNLDVE